MSGARTATSRAKDRGGGNQGELRELEGFSEEVVSKNENINGISRGWVPALP